MIEAGQCEGRAIKGKVQLGETPNGTLQIAIDMELFRDQKSIGSMTTFLYFSDSAALYSYERLRLLGWKGTGPEDIDKLDDQIHNAKPVPLTDQVRVDKEEVYDILDQMRATIPEEIKQARWIVKERQEMLAEAKREAERILKEARDEQMRLISEEEVVKQAERQADEIGRASCRERVSNCV